MRIFSKFAAAFKAFILPGLLIFETSAIAHSISVTVYNQGTCQETLYFFELHKVGACFCTFDSFATGQIIVGPGQTVTSTASYGDVPGVTYAWGYALTNISVVQCCWNNQAPGGANAALNVTIGAPGQCLAAINTVNDGGDGGGSPPPPTSGPPPLSGPPPDNGPPPGNGPPPDNGPPLDGTPPQSPETPQNPQNPDNPLCSGMPVWSVTEPYINLWFHDEPLGYQPVIGSRISFRLSYKEREITAGINTNIFSAGRRWNFSWFSYMALNATNYWIHFPSGRERSFQGTNDYLSNTRLTGSTNTGFTVLYPNGSQDFYGFIVTNNSGVFQEAFLSQHSNPYGQMTVLNYSSYNPANPVVRLTSVVDGDGRTNTISYVSANAYSTNLISQVTDAFGRSASLSYDASGHLTNIIDVANISSSFSYGAGDMVTNLATPYGNTSFSASADEESRSLFVTQPDGGNHLYLLRNATVGLTNSYPANQLPNTSPFSNTFDTTDLYQRDSYHWGPQQYQNLSTTNVKSFSFNDFGKARMRHWLIGATPVGDTLSMEREPSPDTVGTNDGQKLWYDYAGKTNVEYEGAQILPLFKTQVLPNGTNRTFQVLRNSRGAVTNLIGTYSKGSAGTVLLRTNSYVYDAVNGIDLVAETNEMGALVSSNIYNTHHQVVTNYNATNEMTVYTYDGSNRLTSTTNHSGLSTTNIYGGDGYVQQRIALGFSTNSYTYSNGLVLTHSDSRGQTATNTWDALQRLRRVDFSDGTFITNTYQILDLTVVKDRLGNPTTFGYDNLRRLTAVTNALGHYTLYNHCNCGALSSIQDAAGNTTTFNRDNLSRATSVVYADGYTVFNNFNAAGQITNRADSSGLSVTNWFNNQGLPVAISNSFGQLQFMSYDSLNRVTNFTDANNISVKVTYDSLNRPLTRTYPDGGVESFGYTSNVFGATSYTNQLNKVWTYAYDSAYRKTNEIAQGVYTNSYNYDGLGDLLTLTDGNGNTTTWNYDQFGRVTNKLDASNNVVFIFGYDANNHLTNRWTPVTGNTLYAYDLIGNLTGITYQSSPNVGFSYDALNRVTNMVDAAGTTIYTYDNAGNLLSEQGPWADDTVSYAYNSNRLCVGMSVQSPNSPAWTQSYGYDSADRLTNVTSPAGSFAYQLGATASGSPLIKKLLLPGGAYITNSYDGNGRLLGTALKNSSGINIDAEAYVYNLANQRTQQVFTVGNFINFTYDNIGELTSATGMEPGGVTNRLQEQLGYAYDAAGNLAYRTNNGLLQTSTLNKLNELTKVQEAIGGTMTVAGTTTSPATNVTVNGSNAIIYADNTFAATNFPVIANTNVFTAIAQDHYGRVDTNITTVRLAGNDNMDYDLNGNLLRDRFFAGGTNRVFAYDDENQLIAVWVTNTWMSQFTYDGQNRRRIRKEFTWSGSSWTETNEVRYIYDGNVVVQERDSNNLPQVTYTRGSGGSLLARTANPLTLNSQLSPFATAVYHANVGGNITALVYTNQTIAAKYQYDPFGRVLSQAGPLAEANLYRFSSKELHPASSLYYFGVRYYEPNLQRWLNRDPLGESSALNPYRFASNTPTQNSDPDGASDYPYSSANQNTIFTATSPSAAPTMWSILPVQPIFNISVPPLTISQIIFPQPDPIYIDPGTIGPFVNNYAANNILFYLGGADIVGTQIGNQVASVYSDLFTPLICAGPGTAIETVDYAATVVTTTTIENPSTAISFQLLLEARNGAGTALSVAEDYLASTEEAYNVAVKNFAYANQQLERGSAAYQDAYSAWRGAQNAIPQAKISFQAAVANWNSANSAVLNYNYIYIYPH